MSKQEHRRGFVSVGTKLTVATLLVLATTLGFAALSFSGSYQASRWGMLCFILLVPIGTASLLVLVARELVVKPLSRVLEAAQQLERGDHHARVKVRGNDEIGNIALAFNNMGAALIDREQRLAEAQKDIQDLLDNMLQAVFTIGPDLRINHEVSAFARQIFGEVPMVGQPVCDLLQLDSIPDAQAVSRMRFFLDQIYGCDDLQWVLSEPERIRQLNYHRTDAAGKTEERALELSYAPLYRDGAIVKIMLVVKDTTELRRLEAEIARREQQNRESLARLRQIVAMEPESFRTFMSEAHAVLDGCELSFVDLEDPHRRTAAVNSLLRSIQALRGNAHAFNLTAVQDAACAAEDCFQRIRDSEIGLSSKVGVVMHEHIAGLRGLLNEFEELGRRILGGKQESLAESALAFLHTPEDPFDDWRLDLDSLGEEYGEDARLRLLAYAAKMRSEAQAHGFVNLALSLEAVSNELRCQGVLAPQVLPRLQDASRVLLNTRSLAGEVENAELWPYFIDEAKVLLRRLATKIAGRGEDEAGDESIEVMLFAAAAGSFGLPTLANLATEYHRAMSKEHVDARVAINALESWLTDARNLFEMKSRPEMDIDLLGRFHNEAGDLMDCLKIAPAHQIPGLVTATMACARRYRFRLAQENLEALSTTKPTDGPKVAEILRQHVDAYENVRREIRDNQRAEHLLLVMPIAAGRGEEDVENWLVLACEAGLTRLTSYARSLPASRRVLLLQDVRHFDVLIPASRGSKTSHPVQRVLEGRLSRIGPS